MIIGITFLRNHCTKRRSTEKNCYDGKIKSHFPDVNKKNLNKYRAVRIFWLLLAILYCKVLFFIQAKQRNNEELMLREYTHESRVRPFYGFR